ncbi:hypothetical protein HMP0721_2270 [Pseudoramibacter alactolyticus ATCC 23263]|uniref:Uncharacterized protein n=1 Tax=Pseudoramibacter alactolyticus ATCC 23263 TaxID=887929 RepID=E6MJT5_9FIRM|nr:hypothetical protein HMP0721_2270 [Pseudoramibacter alactolyticus ATCC 23263]
MPCGAGVFGRCLTVTVIFGSLRRFCGLCKPNAIGGCGNCR